ncbi:DMT family transporter [Flavicella sp.]|uniref:DMT family transporter n=1 Tax=Flavicella sp. TaxID=2957742 RepID=UPI00260967A3|nr:DMT family transporter [Flavicella sp.]MDG1805299.1 DMT family transporter [Flavicella sp.]
MFKLKANTLGVVLAVLGVILFSAKAIMVKLAYHYEIDSVSLLLLRMLFSLPVYVVIAFVTRKQTNQSIKKTDYLWLVFFGFVGYYLASYFDFEGLQYIKAGLERIVLFVYPTLVLIISRLFLKTKISRIQIFAIFLTYLGVLTAFSGELDLSSENLYLGVGLIFMSALTYAMYLVGSGWLIPKFGVVRFTSYAMIISTICVLLHYIFTHEIDLLGYPQEVYFLGIGMAILSTIIPSFMVSKSIELIGSSNFSIIASIGPISTILLAYIVLGEQLNASQLIGTIIVIVGVSLVSRKAKK